VLFCGPTKPPHTLKMDVDLSKYPKLTHEQVGHVRHFYNLAYQPDGEWKHMGAQEPSQEFLDAYRYQIATIAYATAATHFHYQNALGCVYKPLMRQLIHKMLLRQVWGYWFNASLSGKTVDPSLTAVSDGTAKAMGRPGCTRKHYVQRPSTADDQSVRHVIR
jgi:hypothetical protein